MHAEHDQIASQPTLCARLSAEPPEPIHCAKALLMLHSELPAARRGTHHRSRNHVVEVALARTCDRWHRWVSRVHESSSSRQVRACADSCWGARCNRRCKGPGMRACDRGFVASCRCWLGARGESLLRRPTLRNTLTAPLGDHVSAMLDGDLEAVVGGAKWCSTCDNRKWASSVHAFERVLLAGRAGPGCCLELPADLLSASLAHCGCRGTC